MQTSGLILDVYDDFKGDVIKSLFPSQGDLPELVKTAHALTADEQRHLPDDVFALVMINGEETLRKYACTDEGNTFLSVLYFLENAHKLPEEAQKTAAANLKVACAWYDLECAALEKIAGPLEFTVGAIAKHPYAAFQAAMMGPDVAHQVADNNRAISQIRQHEGNTHRVISPDEIDQVKRAEVGSLMPISAGGDPAVKPSLTVIKKTGAVGHLVTGSKGDKGVPPDDNAATEHKEQPKSAPQAYVMKPHVDVTDLEAHGPEATKKASRYALGEKYPLDSYDQVKTASAYFDEFGNRFTPEDRREYCANLLPRAEELNVKVAEAVRHYGAPDFGPPEQLKIARDLRANNLENPTHLSILDSLFEKTSELGPELFVESLAEFDKLAGLDFLYDRDVPDPFYSVLYKAAEEEYSFVDANNTITERELRALGHIGSRAIKTTFGEDFMVEFQKDPVGIFKSLPRDQKHMIMNMANDNSAPGVALRA